MTSEWIVKSSFTSNALHFHLFILRQCQVNCNHRACEVNHSRRRSDLHSAILKKMLVPVRQCFLSRPISIVSNENPIRCVVGGFRVVSRKASVAQQVHGDAFADHADESVDPATRVIVDSTVLHG
jgi:hypothetical protein